MPDGGAFRDKTPNLSSARTILAAQILPKVSPLAPFQGGAIERAPTAVQQGKEASGPAVLPAAIAVGSGLAMEPDPAVGGCSLATTGCVELRGRSARGYARAITCRRERWKGGPTGGDTPPGYIQSLDELGVCVRPAPWVRDRLQDTTPAHFPR